VAAARLQLVVIVGGVRQMSLVMSPDLVRGWSPVCIALHCA